MKIVITADIHLGHSDHLGRINPDTGLHTRLEDFLKNLDRIVQYITDNNIQLFILAGDIYKTRHPTNTQQEEFAKRLRLLQDRKVNTLILTGNHDIVVSEGSSHTVGVVSALADEKYIQIFDKPGIYYHNGVKIALVPYIYRQKLGLKTNEEACQYYGKVVADLLQQLKDNSQKGKLLLIGHQTIDGAHMPAGYIDPEQVNEVVVPQSFLKGFDCAIFGHIHEHQVVCQSPTTIYTGSIERIDFSQADKPVGFVVYDTDTNTFEFVRLPVSDLYKIKLDLTDGEGDLTERILDIIDRTRLPNGIVKIEVKLRETDICKINKAAIQEVVSKARFDAGMIFDIQRHHVSRNEQVNETISSHEALKKYIEGRTDLKDIADEVYKRGLEIIKLCEAGRG